MSSLCSHLQQPPLMPWTFDDVENWNSLLYPTEREMRMEQRPLQFCSPTSTMTSLPDTALTAHSWQVVACWLMTCRCSCSLSRLIIVYHWSCILVTCCRDSLLHILSPTSMGPSWVFVASNAGSNINFILCCNTKFSAYLNSRPADKHY